MFKLIDFLLHGCWHKWTIKDEMPVWDVERPAAQRPMGYKYVLQCTKCGRIHQYDTWI